MVYLLAQSCLGLYAVMEPCVFRKDEDSVIIFNKYYSSWVIFQALILYLLNKPHFWSARACIACGVARHSAVHCRELLLGD